jgi:hypothetical protein
MPTFGNVQADDFAVTNRNVLSVLRLVCQAEAVPTPAEGCDYQNPSTLRREVFFCLQRLGFLGEREEPQTERELLGVLRESLPIEAEALAVIFALRALCQTHPATAHEEVQEALKWAMRAVLSPL